MRVVATLALTALLPSCAPARGVTNAVAADVKIAKNARAEKRAMVLQEVIAVQVVASGYPLFSNEVNFGERRKTQERSRGGLQNT